MRPQYNQYPGHLNAMLQAALAAANPAAAVRQHLQFNGRSLAIGRDSIIHTHNPADGHIYLVSVGKAAVPMGIAAAQVLGDQIHGGVLVAKRGERDWQAEVNHALEALPPVMAERLQLFEAGHPVPDAHSVAAATAVAELLHATAPHDLVLCLISGGTSALLTQPLLSLEDWKILNQALLRSGCSITELNLVRRQLDQIKGGGLARMAAPATCVSLILSDVVGNPMDAIGSGPTVFTNDALTGAVGVLAHYQMASRLDAAVWQRVVRALHGLRHQGPAPKVRAHNLIVGDVRMAATAAMVKAAQLGFTPQLLTAQLEGEAREVGRVAAALAKDALPGSCLIMGGETTVTVGGPGLGGRNQELALGAALSLSGASWRVVASVATDGEDGPTSAAGAAVTGETVRAARGRQLDARAFLNRNDSYSFFDQLTAARVDTVETGGSGRGAPPAVHVKTGPSGTNVNDLLFILCYPSPQR